MKNTAKEQGWKKTKDPSSGKFYYGNPKTGETSWTPPPGWVDEDDGAEALIAQREAAAKKAETEAKKVEAERARKAEADRIAAEEAAAAERKKAEEAAAVERKKSADAAAAAEKRRLEEVYTFYRDQPRCLSRFL